MINLLTQKNSKNFKAMSYTSSSFIKKDSTIEWARKASDAEKDVLNELISLCDRYSSVTPSQLTLGKKTGICRQYANTRIKKLVEAGLITTENRGFKKTLSYKVHEIFYRTDVRIALRNFLPALWSRSLTALFIHESTQVKKDILNINNVREKRIEYYKVLEKIIATFKNGKLKKYYVKELQKSKYYATRYISYTLLGLKKNLLGVYNRIPVLPLFTPPVCPVNSEIHKEPSMNHPYKPFRIPQQETLKRVTIDTIEQEHAKLVDNSPKHKELFDFMKKAFINRLSCSNQKKEDVAPAPTPSPTPTKKKYVNPFSFMMDDTCEI